MRASPRSSLAGEVVVEAGLAELQLGGDVGVAEAVEAAALHEPLGDVEDPRRGIGIASLSCPRHRHILSHGRVYT
jgi:hypothetical protein